MRVETFELERGQSLWENRVEINLSESGVHPATLEDLAAMGLDLDRLHQVPLAYVQTNGSLELRRSIAAHYPGAGEEFVEVTNGTAEANFLVCQTLIEPGDVVLAQTPNYLQVAGLADAFGARVRTFGLRQEDDWEPDWEAFEEGLSVGPRLVYLSHPNNPSGAVLSEESMRRLVDGVEHAGAWLVADEVYRGAELDGRLSPSFWEMSDRVIVTCGLSKAYGLPGLRIGWIVAPPAIAAECWRRHDYTTIAPGALSDEVACFALEPGHQAQLFERARGFMTANRDQFRDWVESLDGRIDYRAPRAGAYAFVSYRGDVPSVELSDRLRDRHSVLLVPGAWMGMEHYLRFGLGPPADVFAEGLRRTGEELRAL